MKAYIINLACSIDRRKYVKEVLEPFANIEIQFIEGINGKILSEEEREEAFADSVSFQRYGRYLRPGEVGCTLSHHACYKELAQSNENYVLIFEDDIIPYKELVDVLTLLKRYIDTRVPTIILLSGGYWYWTKQKLDHTYQLASIYDANFTHAYLINKKAAQLLVNEKPFWLADDWEYLKSKGIKLQGIFHHAVDQNWNGTLKSLIFDPTMSNSIIRKNMQISQVIESYCTGFTRKILKFIGHYEKESKLR
jgi:glycosyl transferase family 25